MNKQEFHLLADAELNRLFTAIEEQDEDMVLEADILDEILTIILPDQQQYVINKQSYAQQIWLSSPVSGAYHFDYDEASGVWIARHGVELRALLGNELGCVVKMRF